MEVKLLKLFLRKFNTIRMSNSFDSYVGPGAEVNKLFSCSAVLSTKSILLINVKMPTIVGILTLISMINRTSGRLKARDFFNLSVF